MEREHPSSLGYEFAREEEARSAAAELDRRFVGRELTGLRIYRVRWNGNYLVEAVFSDDTPDSSLQDARALLGELVAPVHPEDMTDYNRDTDRVGEAGMF